MQIDGVTSSSGLFSLSKNAQLGQDDFLALMVAQFQNQDPFKPMENGDFLGQMAQFSTVTGLQELNDKFSGLASSIGGDQALQAASLIGRDILVEQDVLQLDGANNEAQLAFVTDGPANVVLDIQDASGQLVASLNAQAEGAGIHRLSWDGRDDDGDRLPAGAYQVVAREATAAGAQAIPVLLGGHIEAVSLSHHQGLNQQFSLP